MSGENIADGIHHHRCFRLAVVTLQLGEVLKAETDSDLVASGRGDKVIETLEVYGRQLIYHHTRFEHTLLVDEFDDTGIVETESRAIDILAVGIVTDTEYLRCLSVIDVESKVVARHYPV